MMQDQYRKGLVLGLTMAEVMMLILFGLLIAFVMVVGKDGQSDPDERRDSILAEIEKLVEEKGSSLEDLRDDFDELWAARQGEAEQRRRAELAEKRRGDALDEKEIAERQRDDALDQKELAEKRRDDALKQKERAEKEKSEAESDRSKAVNDREEAERQRDEALERMETAERERDELRDELHGIDRPPCWKKALRTPYYSFAVALTGDGYEFRRLPTPDEHIGSEAEKLHDEITTGTKIFTEREMLAATSRINDWSRAQEDMCVFYVKITDRTGPQEKKTYKRRRATLENVFYTYDAR